jgi:DNA replication protein DnaC
MLIEPLMQLLKKLKLYGMFGALERQLTDPDIGALRFEERLSMLLQHELAERDNYRLSQRLRVAALPQPACLEDLDTRLQRNLDPALMSTVRDLGWIDRHLNVLITGPTGIGKSFIGAALAHAACRANYHVRCFRLPRLIDELSRAHAFQRRSTFLRTLAKADLLLIDDFAIGPLSDQSKRDLLEILDDRYDDMEPKHPGSIDHSANHFEKAALCRKFQDRPAGAYSSGKNLPSTFSPAGIAGMP